MKQHQRKGALTDDLLKVMRASSVAKEPIGIVVAKVQKIDPTVSRNAIRYHYTRMMGAALAPIWTYSGKRGKPPA